MNRKRTIHFAYAVPRRKVDEVAMRLFHRRFTHPSWSSYAWPSPIHAPYSITHHLAKHLSAEFTVKLYDLSERMRIEPKEGDILLGHMCRDSQSVMWHALNDRRFAKKYLINPYNHDPLQVAFLKDALPKSDRFFAISGQYWLDTFEHSPLAEFREKVVRCNMGINMDEYPLVKREFNPPGERKFFYIGRTGQEKGVDLLEKLSEEVPHFSGGYICVNGDVAGWTKITEPRKLTADFMAKVAEDYDIFINMSRADAQVTTVLEAMCWGFPVACTRESGYSGEDGIFYLKTDDDVHNHDVIERIQHMDSSTLSNIAARNRTVVADRYNWEQFVTTVSGQIVADLNA